MKRKPVLQIASLLPYSNKRTTWPRMSSSQAISSQQPLLQLPAPSSAQFVHASSHLICNSVQFILVLPIETGRLFSCKTTLSKSWCNCLHIEPGRYARKTTTSACRSTSKTKRHMVLSMISRCEHLTSSKHRRLAMSLPL